MKYLTRITHVVPVIFLLLSPTYSSDYNYDEINSPKTSKVSLFKTVLIGLAALSAPAEADIKGCYFGVTNLRTAQNMWLTKIAPAFVYDSSRCSIYTPPPDNRFINTSMSIGYDCMANTNCMMINIKQIRLCSTNFNVTYGGDLIWNPQVPSNPTPPCYECFALNSFYGNGGRDGAAFETTFQTVLNSRACP